MTKILTSLTWYLFRRYIRPIELQALDFLRWKGDRGDAHNDAEFVYMFIQLAHKYTIEDITDRDVKDFARYVMSTRSKFAELQALKAMRCFLRYHKARKVACLSPKLIA